MTEDTPAEYTYKYPKADHTVDGVIFNIIDDALHVLLIRRGRKNEPFFDQWALPGGFIEMGETLKESLRREVKEETGLRLLMMEQLQTFGKPDRDPRGRVISTAFLATAGEEQELKGGDDAAEAKWFEVPAWDVGFSDVTWRPRGPWPETLAFDHRWILIMAVGALRGRIFQAYLGAGFLPSSFTLREMRLVYDIILGVKQDPGNFRRKILATKLLMSVGTMKRGGHRPAAMYTFKPEIHEGGLRRGIYYGS